ncbi:hypothetical protein MATL_G00028050 [Megalops atlanticus]|uniref:Ig-like domain-containing protein n=1 Tax=Megalops atlanticus TaxID=7932 RepID=A0A9D3QHZ6_MEGAT|nr:hypothetical protein MATL_G00028050 [Megalops atlanticus]
MKRARELWISLLLLGLANGDNQIQHQIVFSEGIQLFVESSSSSTDPVVLVFLPSIIEPTSSKTVTLACFVRGLHASLVDISWKINNTVVTTQDSIAQASRETDGTYTAIGLLFITIKEWNMSNNYRCVARQGRKVYQASTQASSCWGMT